MSPGRIFALVLAALIVVGALLRRRRLGNERFALALLAAAALTVYGSHVLAHVDIQKGIENLANALGKWTYALVGAMAFLETGAFVGLVAPGEFTVMLGGVIAGQGEIDIWVLIPLVWACTLAGDSISFFLGRRLGRNFLLKHGPEGAHPARAARAGRRTLPPPQRGKTCWSGGSSASSARSRRSSPVRRTCSYRDFLLTAWWAPASGDRVCA